MNLLATACSNQYEITNPQFYSKFNIVPMPEMTENQMNAVFTAVLSQNMRKFPENIRSLSGALATAITEVHSLAKNMCSQSELLPQLFTNKDAWKVLDSISLITEVK